MAVIMLGLGCYLGSCFVGRSRGTNLIVGSIAHVAVKVPSNGVGLIALVVGSRRTTLPARSNDGSTIERGTEVVVLEMRRRVALVCPLG